MMVQTTECFWELICLDITWSDNSRRMEPTSWEFDLRMLYRPCAITTDCYLFHYNNSIFTGICKQTMPLSIHSVTTPKKTWLPAQWYANAVPAMTMCLPQVGSSIKTAGRIELDFGMEASFDLPNSVLWENSGAYKNKGKSLWTSVQRSGLNLRRQIDLHHMHCQLGLLSMLVHCLSTRCLQCFDAVGWAAGRASGL